MRTLILVLITTIFVGCSSSSEVPEDEAFEAVDLQTLLENKEEYDGRKVALDVYIVGSEYNPSEDGAQFFILSLADTASPRNKSGVFCPKLQNKLRAAEDGYNKEIIEDCYRMSNIAKRMDGQQVTIFGTYKPDRQFYYYENGVDLMITKMRIGNKTINTDFADKSAIAHETPGMLKKIYSGGKKLYKIAKKLSIGI